MSPSFLQGLPKTPLCLEVDPWLPHTHAKPSLITVLCASCPWLYLFVSTYHRLALPPHSEISDSRTLTSPHLADSTNGCSVQACWIDSVTRLWPEARGTGTTWVVGLWWQVPSDGKGHLIQWEVGFWEMLLWAQGGRPPAACHPWPLPGAVVSQFTKSTFSLAACFSSLPSALGKWTTHECSVIGWTVHQGC